MRTIKNFTLISRICLLLFISCTSVKEAAKQVGEFGKEVAKETGKELGITVEEKKTTTQQSPKPEQTLEEFFIQKYGDTPRPDNFEEIKKMLFTYFPDWKLDVSDITPGNDNAVYFAEDLAMKKGTEIIFKDLPIDASAYSEMYVSVTVMIERKYGDDFLLKNTYTNVYKMLASVMFGNEAEDAVAEIPSDIIAESGLKYNEDAVFICKLVDILDLPMTDGTTKPVARIEVFGIIKDENYQEFKKYVLGHPEEFHPDRFWVK